MKLFKLFTALFIFLFTLNSQAYSVEIDLWHGWTGADNAEMLDEVIQKFNKKDNGITVKITAFGWGDFFPKWVLAAKQGNPPDVVLYHHTEVAEYRARGITIPLNDLLKEVPVDMTGVPQALIDASIFDGEWYTIPGDLHPLAVYYNVDLLEKAGLDPNKLPDSGGEFFEWLEKLHNVDDQGKVTQYGLDIANTGAHPRWIFWGLQHQFGGQWTDAEGKKPAMNSLANENALGVLKHLYSYASMGSKFADMDAFSAGKAAITISGPWMANSYHRKKMNVVTGQVPIFGARRGTWANTHCLSISKQKSDEKYLPSMKFVKWFYDNYASPGINVGIIPVSPSALKDPIFTDDPRYKYMKAFVDSLPHISMEPMVETYTQQFGWATPAPIDINTQAVINGKKGIKQALEDMAEGTAEILEEGI